MTVIVLAGGRSRRFGRCKANEPVAGERLISRVIHMVTPLDMEILVATGAHAEELAVTAYPGMRTVADTYPGRGPLAGVHAGLTGAGSFHSLVVACDMPFLNQALLRYMARIAPGYDAVVPRTGDRLEPLHAVYSKACLPHVEKLLEEGRFSLYDLMPRVNVRYVDETEIELFDPEHMSFFNLNTQLDLKKAESLVGLERERVR